MNVLIFWLGTLTFISFGVLACRFHKTFMYFFFGMMLIATCNEGLSINFLSRETYRAASRGFEIHLIDLCAIILFISMILRPREYNFKWFPPLTFFLALYLIIAILSWGNVLWTKGYEITNIDTGPEANPQVLEIGLYPLFEIAKFIRGYFVFWVVVNFFKNIRVVKTAVYSLCLLIIILCISALFQRYIYGMYRVRVFLDTNVFNCYTAIIGAFLMPFAFEEKSYHRSLGIWFCVISALICVILTVSRSSLAGFILACFVSFILCMIRFKNRKNIIFCIFAFVISFGLLIKSASTLLNRFNNEESTSGGFEVRADYIDIAKITAQDNPLGVGLGNFSGFAETTYANFVDSRIGSVMVHNIWYLTAAELGWIGAVIFGLFWLRYISILLMVIFNRKLKLYPLLYALVVGILAGFIVIQLQDLYHFVYRLTSIFFLSNILMGMAIGTYLLIRQNNFEKFYSSENPQNKD